MIAKHLLFKYLILSSFLLIFLLCIPFAHIQEFFFSIISCHILFLFVEIKFIGVGGLHESIDRVKYTRDR